MEQKCLICASPMQVSITLNGLPLRQCEICHLMCRETFNLPTSYYEELGSGDFGEKRTARWRNSLARIRLFKKYVPLQNWCDIGTGEGIFLEALFSIGGSGVGIEPSKSSRNKAKNKNIKIIGETIDAIDSATLIDTRVVSMFHVIEHLEHPFESISLLYQSLKPGSFLIIETPDISSPVFKMSNYKDKLIYPEHFWYFSEKTLCALVEKSGFRVIASGKRDFDQFNLPIKESLRRLSLLRWRQQKIKGLKKVHSEIYKNKQQKKSIFRNATRYILSRLVMATGNLQYTWIVARKQ